MDIDTKDRDKGYMANGYALSGKIMMTAIVILFFVVVLMVSLHVCARWYLLRARRRQLLRNRNRRAQLVFFVDPTNPNSTNVSLTRRGLDDAVVKSLPVFIYSSESHHKESTECAVCLSEFKEKEMGRTLPKCNHSFHIECIDMWFLSHSTCPLCRSLVEPLPKCPIQVVSSSEPEITEVQLSSDQRATSPLREGQVGPSTSSLNSGHPEQVGRVGVTTEVPTRQPNFEGESVSESLASQAFRLPMCRILSLTRILSREKRGALSPGVDVELGKGETEVTRS